MNHRPPTQFRSRVIPTLLIAALALLAATGIAAAPSLFPDPAFPVGWEPVSVVAADFNGDGAIDLAVANHSSGDLSILLARGHGEFEPERRVPMGGEPSWIAAADLNADGKIDLAVADSIGGLAI